ncbi:hypothetical protein [Bacteroides sp. An322]|uniref:hypothetical protein n=1 Tax=Bacteroides sp. An322 TaxID=1965632 RepID=UPI0013022E2D|nr:hypothetical protein [Bacteroides sp. An322]
METPVLTVREFFYLHNNKKISSFVYAYGFIGIRSLLRQQTKPASSAIEPCFI